MMVLGVTSPSMKASPGGNTILDKNLLNNIMQIPITMIIGPPRSGTSLLGRVLGRHPRIATWVEPYYIWDHYFREAPHDERDAKDVTEENRNWIRDAFMQYYKALGVDMVVDKSPRNCLRIPFVRSIFPEARYIFLLRDGRDAVLSIKRQWEDKKEIFSGSDTAGQWEKRFTVLKKWLVKRPSWQLRWRSFYFEIGPPKYWLTGKFLNQIRWQGRFGWGPRFKGWQTLVEKASPYEFYAHQWNACAQGMLDGISAIPKDRSFILRYEDFIENPKAVLENIFSFLHIEFPNGFMEKVPRIWSNNSNKWHQALSDKDLQIIDPVIGKTLTELGYDRNAAWH